MHAPMLRSRRAADSWCGGMDAMRLVSVKVGEHKEIIEAGRAADICSCLLYTSDAADE